VRVEVRLFATLARYLPENSPTDSAFLELRDGSTVADVVSALGIPQALSRITLVNDAEADDGVRLSPGDVVTLFPPLAGGQAAQ